MKEHPDAEWLICTVKDAVKIQLAEIAGLRLGALRIELGLSTNDADRLRQQVEDTLQGVPGKGGASEG